MISETEVVYLCSVGVSQLLAYLAAFVGVPMATREPLGIYFFADRCGARLSGIQNMTRTCRCASAEPAMSFPPSRAGGPSQTSRLAAWRSGSVYEALIKSGKVRTPQSPLDTYERYVKWRAVCFSAFHQCGFVIGAT
ncbi:hypothetical protein C8Q74DRAFT_847978 [Fomes fomentarius]|nr:hypothetical protein C8Q74DRAFT_847978 [Fomes fomentarius]